MFPVDLSKGIEVTDETIAWAYTVTEQSNDGGYFPVGSNLVWHGGLHFPNLDPTATVYALFPGTIVAARLGPPDASASGPARHRNNHYGSDRIILMRHDAGAVFRGAARSLPEAENPLTGHSFFSLVMHVGGIRWDEAERLQGYPWLLSDRIATVRTTGRTPYARRSPRPRKAPASCPTAGRLLRAARGRHPTAPTPGTRSPPRMERRATSGKTTPRPSGAKTVRPPRRSPGFCASR